MNYPFNNMEIYSIYTYIHADAAGLWTNFSVKKQVDTTEPLNYS